MAGRRRVFYEDERKTVAYTTSNGKKDPAHITISVGKPPNGVNWPRTIKMSMDEFFDLVEILDDVCDEIEDETYGVPA